MEKALRLWVGSRLIESGWHWETREEPPMVTDCFDGSQFSYPLFQLLKITIQSILLPLADKILQKIEKKLYECAPNSGTVRAICAAVFILLENIERQLEFMATRPNHSVSITFRM